MARPRKTRSDSVTAAVDAIIAVNMPELQPPQFVTLSDKAKNFWPGIIHARARAEWRDVDLVVAAQLAECQAGIETESAALRLEGMVVPNERGTMVENARNRVVQNLAQRELALMRALLMAGKDGGDARNFKGARAMESSARRAQPELENEDLLA